MDIYAKAKQATYNLIRDDDKNSVAATVFDVTIISLIVVNVLLVVLDTFSGFPPGVLALFRNIEVFSVIVFSVEYAARLWTADKLYPDKSGAAARVRYALSFMAIVDLLAIMPFYLPFVFPVDLRILRMVRLLRLLRLLKVNRYTSALSTVGNVIKRKASQLISSTLVVFILMVIASVLMYSVECEAQPLVFQNAFSGLWWAIATLTTVGYGDIYPITAAGKLFSAVIALLGIGIVAIPTGIISSGFVENIDAERSTEEKHYCPYCGEKVD
ncbi:MAG: ion transporter [Oscillospiraceae bacterium]|jgi:voltage-gated potassium channel|nr:ion transporter [Oscillospiraceae bacterium]